MATGGMGDVLTGLIGGFLSQGYDAVQSAILGAFIHGMSGDILSDEYGDYGFLAGEVAEKVPVVIKRLLEG